MLPSRWRGLPVFPALTVFTVFFIIPLAYFFVISFWYLKFYALVPGFSFHNYITVYEEYLHACLFTFEIALLIAVITTTLAFAIAYLIRFKAGKYGSLLLFITLVTMFGGYLVKIYAWKTILGKVGIFNVAITSFGLVDEEITWLLYSPNAVVLTLVHFLLPFAILPIYGSLRGVEDVPLEAARDVGARSWHVLIHIILPQCQPGLFAAFALSFLISAGDYITPRLVGGPHTFMVGNFIESQFINRLNSPVGSALSYSVLSACLFALILVRIGMASILKPR
jgi:spermidine/putrescine transport system permease protein